LEDLYFAPASSHSLLASSMIDSSPSLSRDAQLVRRRKLCGFYHKIFYKIL
jgi:hypothetical protein